MDVDSVYIDFITGTSEYNANASVSIQPNPSTGIFIVEGNANGPQVFQVDVFNAVGQLRYTWKAQKVDGLFSHQVDMRDAAPDVYFVWIRLGADLFQEKVVIY
jgi:hypothetical protein